MYLAPDDYDESTVTVRFNSSPDSRQTVSVNLITTKQDNAIEGPEHLFAILSVPQEFRGVVNTSFSIARITITDSTSKLLPSAVILYKLMRPLYWLQD